MAVRVDNQVSLLKKLPHNRKTKLKSSQTGLESIIEMFNLSIYPNPGNGIFNLDMDLAANDNVQLKVFDVTGKLLSVQEFLNQSYSLNTKIDLSDHASGMYQLYIKTENALLQRVLIKR